MSSGSNDGDSAKERGRLEPPPLPKEVSMDIDLGCPGCGLVTNFSLSHLMEPSTELLYCHQCCKAYDMAFWKESAE